MNFDSMEVHKRDIDKELHDDFLKMDLDDAVLHYENSDTLGPKGMDYRIWYEARMDGLMRTHNNF